MKSTLLTLALFGANALLSAQPGTSWMVGIPDHLSKEQATAIYQTCTEIVESREPNSTVTFFTTGKRPSTITRVDIENYPNDKVAVRELSSHYTRLISHLKRAVSFEGNTGVPSAVNVPAVADWLSSLPQSAEDCRILLLGSPLWVFDDNFSFVDISKSAPGEKYRRPSHACLRAPKLLSPFSLKGMEGTLEGVRIVWWSFADNDTPVPSAYLGEVEKFWRLYFAELGATMSGLHSDLSIALANFDAEHVSILPPEFNHSENESVMLTLDELKERVSRVTVEPEPISIQEPTILNEPEPLDDQRNVESTIRNFERRAVNSELSVGIMWNVEGVDCDLWVFYGEDEYLSYKNPQSSFGRHLKDLRNATGANYEQVVLNRLDDVIRARVNLYSTNGRTLPQKLSGQYMVRWQGETLVRPFIIRARKGNSGGDIEKFDSSPYWAILDLSPPLRDVEATAFDTTSARRGGLSK